MWNIVDFPASVEGSLQTGAGFADASARAGMENQNGIGVERERSAGGMAGKAIASRQGFFSEKPAFTRTKTNTMKNQQNSTSGLLAVLASFALPPVIFPDPDDENH